MTTGQPSPRGLDAVPETASEVSFDAGFDAVVLAGGAGRRLGGVDKAALTVAGRTLLERTLTAVADAGTIVVVGPDRELPDGVRATLEQPPGGGPVAALAAGLATLDPDGAEVVVVLACDMPFLDMTAVRRLVATTSTPGVLPPPETDGAVLVDEDGRRQHLAAAYRRESLERAVDRLGEVRDAAMRNLARCLTIVEIPADPGTTLDCDTWPDVHRSHRILEER